MPDSKTLTFSMPVSDLDKAPKHVSIVATEAERAALAERFGLLGLSQLGAEVDIWDAGDEGGVRLKGHMQADLVQRCTVTLEPVPEQVDADFELILVDPETADRMDQDEAYLDPEIPDYDALEGDNVPVGEIVAQTLSILMDPYPRAAGAELTVDKKKDISVNEAEIQKPNPFAVLQKLKDES